MYPDELECFSQIFKPFFGKPRPNFKPFIPIITVGLSYTDEQSAKVALGTMLPH